MNKIEISGINKMPTSMETWQFLSDMVSTLSQLGAIAGKGVYALPGHNINNGGFVVWDGEVLPVMPGSGSYIIVKEVRKGVEHEGKAYNYYTERYAEPCANTSGAVLISSIKALPSLIELNSLIADLKRSISALALRDDNLIEVIGGLADLIGSHAASETNPHKVTKAQVGLGDIPNAVSSKIDLDSNLVLATAKAVCDLNKTLTAKIEKFSPVPSGTICMWSGKTAPDGWALCDGQEVAVANGARIKLPDLRGQFIVGYDKSDSDYDQPGNRSHFLKQGYVNDNEYFGKKGGEKRHILSISEMPAHSHKIWEVGKDSRPQINNAQGISYRCMNPYINAQDDDFSQSIGGSAAHENRPPYYTLAYIIKL